MSQVKVQWVYPDRRVSAEDGFTIDELKQSGRVPVIELASLAEVVEGLIRINTEMHFVSINRGGTWQDKRCCEKAAAEAQRLLAMLEETPKQDSGSNK